MSDLQLFTDVFAVDFPAEIAEMVLDRISSVYGAEFSKKYAGYSDAELTQVACTVLSGLTPADIRRGIVRMNSEEWCPNLPKFRSWCEQSGDWWTADQAWAKAMMFENNNDLRITTLTKVALDEVRHVLNVEGQKSAHYAFKDIYESYLRTAKEKGRVQEFWKKPEQKKLDNECNRVGVPCPEHLLQKVNALKKAGEV